MYGRGKDYFSYIDGLPLPADKISGLLKALGAPSIAPATLEELGGKIQTIRCVARPESLHAFHRGRCVDGDLSSRVSVARRR